MTTIPRYGTALKESTAQKLCFETITALKDVPTGPEGTIVTTDYSQVAILKWLLQLNDANCSLTAGPSVGIHGNHLTSLIYTY